MSDAFIQHLIDRTIGTTTTTPITIRHALRPDMLWRPYSQQSDEISMLDEHQDMTNSSNNNKETKNKNKDEPDAEDIIPHQDGMNNNNNDNDNDYENTDQTKNNGIKIDSRREIPKPEPHKLDNATGKRENSFHIPFSSMPKRGGRQEKQGDSQTDSNRQEHFLSHTKGSEVDSGLSGKIPFVGGHDSQRADKDGDIEQNPSELHLNDNKLLEGARTSHRRSSGGEGTISSSTDTSEKRNTKSLPTKEKQIDDRSNTEAERGSSYEMSIKGGTRPQSLQPSNPLPKQKTRPTPEANSDTSVTISIGRIEVKAVSSHMQQQQQTSLAPKKGFGLSLQEYIKLRDEGQL